MLAPLLARVSRPPHTHNTRITLERPRLFPGGYAPRPPWLALRARLQNNIDQYIHAFVAVRDLFSRFFFHNFPSNMTRYIIKYTQIPPTEPRNTSATTIPPTHLHAHVTRRQVVPPSRLFSWLNGGFSMKKLDFNDNFKNGAVGGHAPRRPMLTTGQIQALCVPMIPI